VGTVPGRASEYLYRDIPSPGPENARQTPANDLPVTEIEFGEEKTPPPAARNGLLHKKIPPLGQRNGFLTKKISPLVQRKGLFLH